jgi:hypothetical protein
VKLVVAQTGEYTITDGGGITYYSSTPAPRVCIAGVQTRLVQLGQQATSGSDAVGAWQGTTVTFVAPPKLVAATVTGTPIVAHTFKQYPATPHAAVLTATYLTTINTSNCDAKASSSGRGGIDAIAAELLAIDTTKGVRGGGAVGDTPAALQVLSWTTGLELTVVITPPFIVSRCSCSSTALCAQSTHKHLGCGAGGC